MKLVEGQGYIHYRKGSLVMYALKEAIGEAAVNRGLKRFIAKYAFTEAPFPTSADLIAEFRAEAGPEQQKLITDLFEKITLYDLRVADVEVAQVDTNRYRVDVVVEGKQFHADGEGREVEVPMDVYVDVAVFPEASAELGEYDLPAPIAIERRRVITGTQTFSFTVNERPDRVGVDPYHTMVDRNPDDNLKDS